MSDAPRDARRCGLLMALRALKTGGVTGLVVTASHNPVEDNGVKLVDPTGYMLDQAWEVSSTGTSELKIPGGKIVVDRAAQPKGSVPEGC